MRAWTNLNRAMGFHGVFCPSDKLLTKSTLHTASGAQLSGSDSQLRPLTNEPSDFGPVAQPLHVFVPHPEMELDPHLVRFYEE